MRRLLSRIIRNRVATGFTILLALLLVLQTPISALTPVERRNLAFKDISFIDDPCTITGGTGTDVAAGLADEANAKVVIGIAKTYNLGKEGALIGLMTAITESHLKIYANSGIPISLDNPNKQAVGNDHDSLGIMQQRVSTGWSTKGNSPTKEVVDQLMDPAYNAQAFFGTPPGAQLPSGLYNDGSALKKGLQNLPGGWQTMDPGAAAQAVQISAYPDRYNLHKAEAQSLLNDFWDTSPPIPLPIPITGGAAANTASGGCNSAVGGNIFNTIVSFAWPKYDASLKTLDAAKPEYKAATETALDAGKYTGGCTESEGCRPGVDCGAFITRVMQASGTDPNYNNQKGNTFYQKQYLDAHPEKYQKLAAGSVHGTGDLNTDNNQVYIAIIANQHTYFYTGKFNYTVGGEQKKWGSDGASASIGPGSWRVPMASNAFDFEQYSWYLIK